MRLFIVIFVFLYTICSHATDVTAKSAVIEVKIGQDIYEHACILCHQDGVAGAPRFNNVDDWSIRLQKQDLEKLTLSAIKGLNAMPAKGSCSECSDEDIRAAIKYMLPDND